jgi:DNA adenine methylase
MSNATPFVKWVGGKKRLLSELKKLFPDDYKKYYEPFLGGGSVFFSFSPKIAVIGDLNKQLINCYLTIRDNCDELKEKLLELEKKNTQEEYYELRNQFNILKHDEKNIIYVSALFIYLNKAGYGGVYRENSKGEFNVPYGKYKSLNLYDENKFNEIRKSLKDVMILNSDYKDIIRDAKTGDFIYVDPPYYKENNSSFTKYQKQDFNEDNQRELFKLLDSLDKKGVYFLLSNSNTEFITTLYKDYNILEVSVGRHINNKNKTDQKKNNEVLIYNYKK